MAAPYLLSVDVAIVSSSRVSCAYACHSRRPISVDRNSSFQTSYRALSLEGITSRIPLSARAVGCAAKGHARAVPTRITVPRTTDVEVALIRRTLPEVGAKIHDEF